MIDTENTEIILQAGRADDSTAADVQRYRERQGHEQL